MKLMLLLLLLPLLLPFTLLTHMVSCLNLLEPLLFTVTEDNVTSIDLSLTTTYALCNAPW